MSGATTDLNAGAAGVRGRSPSPRAILWAVGFSVFVAADDLTVVSTMLRPIIGDLGLVLPDGLDDAAWVVNAYLIAFIAVMPVAGRISDVIGRRRTFAIAYLVFIVGTIWIPLSTSLGPFLMGRVLTAIGGGAMVPIALAVVGDVYPERERARALGTLGAIETMGWVWGPLYGAMLVRFLSWRWQFWLNVPLAVVGLAAVWWGLAEHDRPDRDTRVDWLGAGLLTTALVSLNLALLGSAEVQSVTGLDELRGGSGPDLRLLYPVAFAAGLGFVWRQRRSRHPLVDRDLFAGRGVRVALIVNFVVGAALVIAMVDVPLFVNAVEVDLERSAVVAGWVLSALTAAMAVMSYVGGRVTERTWYGPPVVLGLAASTVAYGLMGLTWAGDTPYPVLAAQLALLGAGFGLTVAPTTSAVVDHAAPDSRGAAAAVVMVVRLLGLSVGLSALTAWGLARFNRLRGDIELPPLTDPGFEAALRSASADLTSQAIAETFAATAVVVALGLAISVAFLRRRSDLQEATMTTHDDDHVLGDDVLGDGVAPDDGAAGDGAPDELGDDDAASLADTDRMPVVQAEPPPAPVEPAPVEPAPAPPSWVGRHVGGVLVGLALVLLATLGVVLVLFSRLQAVENDLETTRADMERVEAGAALFASQVTGFQEQLGDLSPAISAGLDEAITGLDTFSTSTLDFTVNIDEQVDIDTEVVLNRTISVPIKTSIPINESFDTTITIAGPFGIDIPLDVTVPVDIDVPVDLVVDIPIDETVPIQASVPVKIDVPIGVDVADTQLAALADSLAVGLQSFADIIEGLGA